MKIMNEKQYRLKLLGEARLKGCEKEMLILFDKYDKLMRNCTNIQERENIGKLGILEIHNLLDDGHVGIGGELTINGQIVKVG